MQDLDKRINWQDFYANRVQDAKISGREMLARCPFHDDKHASLSMNLDTGVWKCHACDAHGNGQTFLQKIDGIAAGDAIAILYKAAGMPNESPTPKAGQHAYTVADYCNAKRLPPEFIKAFNIKNNKTIGISIPYMDESGAVIGTRQRFSGASTGPKFSWVRGSKVHLYGLWRLAEFRPGKKLYFVEGECLPGDAEILTDEGWRRIDEYHENKVVQWSWNNTLEFVEPIRFISQPFSGDLIQFSNTKCFFAKVTPEHKMVYLSPKSKTKKEHWIKAKDHVPSNYIIPRTGFLDGKGIDLTDDEIKLAIAVLADASIHKRKTINNYAFFHLMKERKIKRLIALLESTGIPYKKTPAKNANLGFYIKFILPDKLAFINHDRVMPVSWICDASTKQRQLILDEMMLWDGNTMPDRYQVEFSSKSYDNVKWMQTMAHTNGMVSTIVKRRNSIGEWYKASVLYKKTTSSSQSMKKESIPFSGEVYCLTVPSGMFLVRQNGCISVTGNSDTHTLWYHGIPALGVPGASTFQREWAEMIAGMEIIIHKEPDHGGEVFVRKICECLVSARHEGKVLEVQIPGFKDPSELHINDPDAFMSAWESALSGAHEIDIRALAVRPEEVMPGAPVSARYPLGWRVDPERGVFQLTEKGLSVNICPVPVLLSRRLKSIDTGDEKIELVFKRDNAWHRVVALRSTVFQKTKIPILTDKGLPLTSESAGAFVKYLGDMEAENIDLLQLCRSTERMGWIAAGKFLPGLANDVILDIDSSMRGLADGYINEGDVELWKAEIGKARENPIARLIIACSFAAPLLKPLNHRVFIVHNWGDSRSGKTAALFAALSVWGDPAALVANFNATKVGLERIANFYNDLPLGIDERQVAGNKQEFVDSLVYLLGLGKGRTRGAKTGGVQHGTTWRCLILTTGEMPLISESSQGGIRTRVIEIFGRPFAEENDAKQIYTTCAETYGHAGIMFVQKLLYELGQEATFLKDIYNEFLKMFTVLYPDHLGSHVSAMAVIATADMLASQWIWGIEAGSAREAAYDMVSATLKQVETAKDNDVGDRAWEFLCGWVSANIKRFDNDHLPPRYGFFDLSTGQLCILPQFAEKAMSEVGFSFRKSLIDFADKGRIEVGVNGEKREFTVKRKFPGGARVRVVIIKNPDEFSEYDHLPEVNKVGSSKLEKQIVGELTTNSNELF